MTLQIFILTVGDPPLRRTSASYPNIFFFQDHGLDKSYLYPYIRFKPNKPKPTRTILASLESMREKHERDRYTHWDSDDSDSDSIIKKVDSLTTLCLKRIFSKNMLGKVPRKKRKVENDAFDSFNDFSIDSDISNIISSLNDDLKDDCVRRNRKDSLIAIAINDIIGVPNFVSNFKMGNENVARSSNDVFINDKNENSSNLNDGKDSLNENDKIKDLNDVGIEDEGTDTVVSASDISTELHLIESESRDNTPSAAVCEKIDDTEKGNDLGTGHNLGGNKHENNKINKDEIRNFKSVDAQKYDILETCNETNVQNERFSTEDVSKRAVLNHTENNIKDLDNQQQSDIMQEKTEIRNDSTLKIKNNYENISMNDDLDSQQESDDTQQNSDNGNDITNKDSTDCNDTLETKNNYENVDTHDYLEIQNSKHENKDINDSDNQYDLGDMQQNSNNDNAITNNGSEINKENLKCRSNYDVEAQNSNHENEDSDCDSTILNDNLGASDPVIDNLKIQNENSATKHNKDTDILNDDVSINHTGIKNNDVNDINNHCENQSENLGAINAYSDCSNSNSIDNDNIENTPLHRIEDESCEVSKNVLEEPNSVAKDSTEKVRNSVANGIDENDTTNDNCEESIQDTKKLTNESPIKHSIENLIGDTDKNPDKYIDEVISSIEDIINKNSRNDNTNDHLTDGENSNQMDDRTLMDALDTQIGEGKDKADSEKITLDDLLPKNNTPMELDDISDDDFNFDA